MFCQGDSKDSHEKDGWEMGVGVGVEMGAAVSQERCSLYRRVGAVLKDE